MFRIILALAIIGFVFLHSPVRQAGDEAELSRLAETAKAGLTDAFAKQGLERALAEAIVRQQMPAPPHLELRR